MTNHENHLRGMRSPSGGFPLHTGKNKALLGFVGILRMLDHPYRGALGGAAVYGEGLIAGGEVRNVGQFCRMAQKPPVAAQRSHSPDNAGMGLLHVNAAQIGNLALREAAHIPPAQRVGLFGLKVVQRLIDQRLQFVGLQIRLHRRQRVVCQRVQQRVI